MIVGPPTHPKRYLTTAANKLAELAAAAREALAVVDANAAEGERLLFQFLSCGGVESEEAARIFSVGPLYRRGIEGGIGAYSVEDVTSDIRTVLDHGTDFVKYLVNSSKHVLAEMDRREYLGDLMAAAGPGAEAYGFVPGDPANLEDSEYVAAMGLLEGLKKADEAVADIKDILRDVSARMDAFEEVRAHQHVSGGWRPEHGPVETLWHASAHAAQIAKEGFHPVRPKSRKGLGAFGMLQTASFTYDKSLAENIAAVMREVWDIEHGHLKASDIAATIRQEGIDAEVDFRPHVGTNDIETLTDKVSALKLFRIYLYMSDNTDNPVIIGIEELADALRDVRREDIGVLECQVRLDGTEEHLVGECEFRVRPDAVLEIKLLDAPGERLDSGPQDVPAAMVP